MVTDKLDQNSDQNKLVYVYNLLSPSLPTEYILSDSPGNTSRQSLHVARFVYHVPVFSQKFSK